MSQHPPPKDTASLAEATRQAYKKIPEISKIFFLQVFTLNTSNDLVSNCLNRWLELSKLNISLSLAKKNLDPPTPEIRKRLDATLMKEKNEKLLFDLLEYFFNNFNYDKIGSHYYQIQENFERLYPAQTTQSYQPKIFEKLSEIFGENPFFELYQAFMGWTNSLQKSELDLINSFELYRLKSRMICVHHLILFELHTLSLGLNFDVTQFRTNVETLIDLNHKFQSQFKELSQKYTFESSSWTHSTELENILKKLFQKVKQKEALQQHPLALLNQRLKELEIQHRSPQRQRELTTLKEDVCIELQKNLQEDPRQNFKGPTNPNEWIRWALTLKEQEFLELQKSLESLFPKLNQFISECELGWLNLL